MSWFLSCFSHKRKGNRQQLEGKPGVESYLGKSQLKLNDASGDNRLLRNKNATKIKLPSKISTHSVIRTEDYTEIKNISSGVKIHLTDQQLNFQMDYDDGISHNLTINTFNYKPKQQNSDVMYYKHFGHNFKQLQEKEDEKPILQREIFNQQKAHDIDEQMQQQQPTGF